MAFNLGTIEAVWRKATIIMGVDANVWRKDVCGAWIYREHYGNRDSLYGWEVDHIVPNGNDSIFNLQPLQWENNCAKGDGRLVCVITSSGTSNVRR